MLREAKIRWLGWLAWRGLAWLGWLAWPGWLVKQTDWLAD